MLEVVADQKPGLAAPRPGDRRTIRQIRYDDFRRVQRGLEMARNHSPPQEPILPDTRKFEPPDDRLDQSHGHAEMGVFTEAVLDLDVFRLCTKQMRGTVVLFAAGDAEDPHFMTHARQRARDADRTHPPARLSGSESIAAQNEYLLHVGGTERQRPNLCLAGRHQMRHSLYAETVLSFVAPGPAQQSIMVGGQGTEPVTPAV